jgi:hypothetical protein
MISLHSVDSNGIQAGFLFAFHARIDPVVTACFLALFLGDSDRSFVFATRKQPPATLPVSFQDGPPLVDIQAFEKCTGTFCGDHFRDFSELSEYCAIQAVCSYRTGGSFSSVDGDDGNLELGASGIFLGFVKDFVDSGDFFRFCERVPDVPTLSIFLQFRGVSESCEIARRDLPSSSLQSLDLVRVERLRPSLSELADGVIP